MKKSLLFVGPQTIDLGKIEPYLLNFISVEQIKENNSEFASKCQKADGIVFVVKNTRSLQRGTVLSPELKSVHQKVCQASLQVARVLLLSHVPEKEIDRFSSPPSELRDRLGTVPNGALSTERDITMIELNEMLVKLVDAIEEAPLEKLPKREQHFRRASFSARRTMANQLRLKFRLPISVLPPDLCFKIRPSEDAKVLKTALENKNKEMYDYTAYRITNTFEFKYTASVPLEMIDVVEVCFPKIKVFYAFRELLLLMLNFHVTDVGSRLILDHLELDLMVSQTDDRGFHSMYSDYGRPRLKDEDKADRRSDINMLKEIKSFSTVRGIMTFFSKNLNVDLSTVSVNLATVSIKEVLRNPAIGEWKKLNDYLEIGINKFSQKPALSNGNYLIVLNEDGSLIVFNKKEEYRKLNSSDSNLVIQDFSSKLAILTETSSCCVM